MFGITTPEKMPEEFTTSPAVWDGFIGHVWQSVLAATGFNLDASIIDIAPGSAAKIGLGLAELGFRGELFVVDASAEALEALRPKYEALLPNANIHWLYGTLKDQAEKLPANPGYLLGNHILDDMILAGAAQKETFAWAAAYTNDPSAAFRRSWQILLDDPALLSTAKQAARSEVLGAIDKLCPQHVILSQYPSSALYSNGMASLNDEAFSVFSEIKIARAEGVVYDARLQDVLNTHKNYNNKHIGENVLNAKYWMLCSKKM